MGAEFTVYQDEQHLLLDPIVGVLAVHSIRPFETIMRVPQGCHAFTLKNPAVAIQTKAGRDQALKLHVPLEERYLSVFQAFLSYMQGTDFDPCKIALVQDRSAANLEAVTRANKISFNILDTRIDVRGQLAIPHTVDANVESVLRVLEVAAHYFYHLNRTHTNPVIQKNIKVEMFTLVKSRTIDDLTGLAIDVPLGDDLIVGNKISRNVCDHINPPYGFSIKNTSERHLFVNCFYFDNTDLSISKYW